VPITIIDQAWHGIPKNGRCGCGAIEQAGRIDAPYRRVLGAGAAITTITDPWGTRVELVQLGMQ
jgi:hypothetical protein